MPPIKQQSSRELPYGDTGSDTSGFKYVDILRILGSTEPNKTPLDDVSRNALKEIEEARKLRDEAIARGEAFSLAKASNEELITMMRAVAIEGAGVSKEHGIDPNKLTLAEFQLSDALGHKLEVSTAKQAAIDEPTYIIASLALAKLRNSADVASEQEATSFALGAMEDPEYLEQVEHATSLGHHTGELAVQAIVEYANRR